MAEEDANGSIFRRWGRKSNPKPVPGTVKAIHTKTDIPPSPSAEDTGRRNASGEKASIHTEIVKKSYHVIKMEQLLAADNIDSSALRKVSWNGVPPELRSMVWQLLLGYMPTNKGRRDASISRKRKEYFDSIPTYFDNMEDEQTMQEGEILRQIIVDLPRTCPNTPFFHQASIQKAMERILYIYSIRHPASGYVQGMNDLLTPLLLVFMHPYVEDVLRCDVALLDEHVVLNVEADAYWCLTKLLDNIQDHYTFSQPGLQRMVLRLEDLVKRVDEPLHDHFVQQGVEYMQFAFRWMNCILLREVPLRAILRVWDTYLSEDRGGFENFHVYVCVVLLKKYRDKLVVMEFQDILTFLQDMPTSEWTDDVVEPILSEAFILSTLFDESPSHLT
jgi:TBC1 domain family member 2